MGEVGPPPFIGLWLVTLHMWPTFRPHGDSHFLLCSWWGKDGIPWCHVRCFCIHYKICMLSWCARVNSHSFTTYPLILVSTLCFWLMTFAPWPMSSLLNQLEWTSFCVLHCFMRWPWQWQFKQRKDFIEIGTLQTCFSLLLLRSLGVYINKLMIFFILC
jgi:hypothetical protein